MNNLEKMYDIYTSMLSVATTVEGVLEKGKDQAYVDKVLQSNSLD